MTKRSIWKKYGYGILLVLAGVAAVFGISAIRAQKALQGEVLLYDAVMELAKEECGEMENHGEQTTKQQFEPSELLQKWKKMPACKTVTVALIDTGLNYGKFPYKERVIDIGRKFSGAEGDDSLTDENGHGTELADLIAENTDEHVLLMPIKVAGENGKARLSNVCKAMLLAKKKGADIINISMNTLQSDGADGLGDTISKVTESGALVVVSAGNRGVNVKNVVPANLEQAIVVTASDEYGNFAGYSNYGETVDLCAPGTYKGKCGTSYAAAYVSGFLAYSMTRGDNADEFMDSLHDRGAYGWDPYYGNGLFSLYKCQEEYRMEDFFGADWEKMDSEFSILEMEDYHYLTDMQLNRYITESDLADVGCYLSGLEAPELKELLARDTVLNDTCMFLSGSFGSEKSDENKIRLNSKKECLFYQKCMEEYEKEARYLKTSSYYAHKAGYFKLKVVDVTGNGYSTTYEICARVCLSNRALDGSSPENGQVINREIAKTGNNANEITVWSRLENGCRDTLSLQWKKVNGCYAGFYDEESGKGGHIFVPHIQILCPGYTLMRTADMSHTDNGVNCGGRGNFYEYTKDNIYATRYKTYKEHFHLRKYGMQVNASYQDITPQLNTTHMNLSDVTSKKDTSLTTTCTMYIYLDSPSISVTVNPNGELWNGQRESTSLTIINGKTRELGIPTVTNYRAVFYGGGDLPDPAGDITVMTSKQFAGWQLTTKPGKGTEYGNLHSYMNGTQLCAGNMEYDQNAAQVTTTGEIVEVCAEFAGGYEIMFPEAPKRDGYTFLGWYTGDGNQQGSLACDPLNAGKQTITIQADCSFCARWQKNSYRVSFFDRGNCVAQKQYEYRHTLDLSSARRQEDGQYVQEIGNGESIWLKNTECVFLGWSTEPDGEIVSAVNVPSHDRLQLFAVWSTPTSGMKQVVLAADFGGKVQAHAIPTFGSSIIHTTLGLRSYFYQTTFSLQEGKSGFELLTEGQSYAQDYAGNRTAIGKQAIPEELPISYTCLYKFYQFNPNTGQWDIISGTERSDVVDIKPGERGTYVFASENFIDVPEGYQFHHAMYENAVVTLPHKIEIEGRSGEINTVRTISIYYEPQYCTVTFDANGGTFLEGGATIQKRVLYGVLLGELPGLTRGEYYELNGFYYLENEKKIARSNDVVKTDITLVAIWEKRNGTIRYDAATNGGHIADNPWLDMDVVYEEQILYEGVYAGRDGYEFKGWSLTVDGDIEKQPLYMNKSSICLYAQFERPLTVVFHQWNQTDTGLTEKGDLPVLSNQERSVVILSPCITPYNGWQAWGWTKNALAIDGVELGEADEVVVEKDEAYYAIYKRTVTLCYDTAISGQLVYDTGEAWCSTSGCRNVDAEFVIKPAPYREFYQFCYWMDEAGNCYSPGERYASSVDLTLTAVWEPKQIEVIYDAKENGGFIDGKETQKVKVSYKDYADTGKAKFCAQKEGYTFLGWNTDKDAKAGLQGGIQINSEEMERGFLTLYAIYKKEVCAQFYQKDDKSPQIVTAVLHNKEEKVIAKAPQIQETKEWKAIGWTTDKTDKSMVELCIGSDFWLSGDCTYYAIYQKNVTLSYETGMAGKDIDSMSQTLVYNTGYSDTNNLTAVFTVAGKLKRMGACFLDWEDELGNIYHPDDEIAIAKDTTLYAKWDFAPEIVASDRYFTLGQAVNAEGRYINSKTLLDENYVKVSDREDAANRLKVTLLDFSPQELLALKGDCDMTITFEAKDSCGNVSRKSVILHVIDTTLQKSNIKRSIRFISKEYYQKDGKYVLEQDGGLSEDSIWREDTNYAKKIERAIENAEGEKKQYLYVHKFLHEDIKEIQKSVEKSAQKKDP